jgi:hypothetical protein
MADPRQIVRSSNQLWGSQVALVDADDNMDFVSGDPSTVLDREAERLNPVIYEFNGGRNCFRRKTNPYA